MSIHLQVDCEKCDSLMAEEITDILSMKEVAVDHCMKYEHKERKSTVDLVDSGMDSNNCSITWTLSLASPSSTQNGKTFVVIGVQFRMLFRQEVPRYGLKRDKIEMQSKEEFRSKVLKAMTELEKKLLSKFPNAPEGTTLYLKGEKK